jgi:hypothetical protein
VRNSNKRLNKYHWQGVEAAAALVVAQAVYVAKTTHTVKTQHENMVLLIQLNLKNCELTLLLFSVFEEEIF